MKKKVILVKFDEIELPVDFRHVTVMDVESTTFSDDSAKPSSIMPHKVYDIHSILVEGRWTNIGTTKEQDRILSCYVSKEDFVRKLNKIETENRELKAELYDLRKENEKLKKEMKNV